MTVHGDKLSFEQALRYRQERQLGRRILPHALDAGPGGDGGPSAGFGLMFPALRQPEHCLPSTRATINGLDRLAKAMVDMRPESGTLISPEDSTLSTAITYLGQFVDHDITLQGDSTDDALKALVDPANQNPAPLPNLFTMIANGRTGQLDLDSVYEPQTPGGVAPPRNVDRMVLGPVAPSGNRPPGKDNDNDLPRRAANRPAQAEIGDPRNDENLIVAQLHVAFLRAHNALVSGGLTFADARRRLRRIFQNLVLQDFAAKVCGRALIDDIVTNGRRFWQTGGAAQATIPIEFSVAAYRFGHSMIRRSYDYNRNFGIGGALSGGVRTPLDQIFRFTELSAPINPQTGLKESPLIALGGLPENWIIEWERIFASDKARKIDVLLTEPLNTLGQPRGESPIMARLALRNLLRGFLFSLPTGQSVANAMGLRPLAGAEFLAALPLQNGLPDVVRAENFHNQTPLWFYILAEAGVGGGNALGPVGGRIVAETIHALIEASDDSILQAALTPDEQVDFRGFLRLSGNLP